MQKGNHTPGPLFVRQPESAPYAIQIIDQAGNVVFQEHRAIFSTRQTSVADVMNAVGMGDPKNPGYQQHCIDTNQRQLADFYLRAAAPELLEELRAAHQIIRNALAVMTTAQKNEWGCMNELHGVAGEGITRANERDAVLAKAIGNGS